MNVLEIMDVIICAIILMVHSIAIVIQATCYIQMELLAQVDHKNIQLMCTYMLYVDINECLVDNGGCEFSCTNLEGINNATGLGYQCGCDNGYQLTPNNHDCEGMCVYT